MTFPLQVTISCGDLSPGLDAAHQLLGRPGRERPVEGDPLTSLTDSEPIGFILTQLLDSLNHAMSSSDIPDLLIILSFCYSWLQVFYWEHQSDDEIIQIYAIR